MGIIDMEVPGPGADEVALAFGVLVELGEMTPAELAVDLAIRPSAATTILLRLERAGRVCRRGGGACFAVSPQSHAPQIVQE